MNERIRELAIEAGLPTALDYHQKRYEKFAELLIKECAKTIEDVHSKDLGNYLKEVFGVKE